MRILIAFLLVTLAGCSHYRVLSDAPTKVVIALPAEKSHNKELVKAFKKAKKICRKKNSRWTAKYETSDRKHHIAEYKCVDSNLQLPGHDRF